MHTGELRVPMQRLHPWVSEHLEEPRTTRFSGGGHFSESSIRISKCNKERGRKGIHYEALTAQPLQPLANETRFFMATRARQGVAMNGCRKVEVRRLPNEIFRERDCSLGLAIEGENGRAIQIRALVVWKEFKGVLNLFEALSRVSCKVISPREPCDEPW